MKYKNSKEKEKKRGKGREVKYTNHTLFALVDTIIHFVLF